MIALWGTIPELFEAQASQVAARTAVSDGKRETSFEELRQQVDTIAGFLLQQDLPKGAMIEHGMLLADGLRLERDLGLTRDDRVLAHRFSCGSQCLSQHGWRAPYRSKRPSLRSRLKRSSGVCSMNAERTGYVRPNDRVLVSISTCGRV